MHAFLNRRIFQLFMLALLAAILAGSLAACASLAGARDVEIPLAKLQAGLDRRFPINDKAIDIFNVQLTRPQLSMLGNSGRIGLSVDALVAPRFLRQSWSGSMSVSGKLYLDPSRNAVMMADPQLDRLLFNGIDERAQRQLEKLANSFITKAMADVPLYHFRPEDLRYGGVQFVPTALVTTPRSVIVSVAPAAR